MRYTQSVYRNYLHPINPLKFFIKLLICSLVLFAGFSNAQPVPAVDENIPFLVTFGKNANKSFGDDDYIQIFFLSIPKSMTKPIYVRVFDPETAGQNDELNGVSDTKTKFSIYGGAGAFSNPEARAVQPTGKYNSGTLLQTKTFGSTTQNDNGWYTFESVYPTDGEWVESEKAYIIKIVAEGVEGDDGNLYRYFFSSQPDKNVALEGANAFTYEYTFRMPDKMSQVCHLYPYMSKNVVSIQQHNFDWDDAGVIKIVSYDRKGEWVEMSNDNTWKTSKHTITEGEKEKSLDIQFVNGAGVKPNNNLCFYITNQYGESLPFYTIPIGGKPVFRYSNSLEKLRETERVNKEKIYQRVKQ